MGLLNLLVRPNKRFLSQFPRRLLNFGTKLAHPRFRLDLFDLLLLSLVQSLHLLCHSFGLMVQMNNLRRLWILLHFFKHRVFDTLCWLQLNNLGFKYSLLFLVVEHLYILLRHLRHLIHLLTHWRPLWLLGGFFQSHLYLQFSRVLYLGFFKVRQDLIHVVVHIQWSRAQRGWQPCLWALNFVHKLACK